MACIRKRRGKWVVDYRDAAGIRRWVTCRTRREAEDVLGEKVREARQRTRPAVAPEITVAAYARRWLDLIAATVKRRTIVADEKALRCHLLPALGSVKVRQLSKGQIKALLARKVASGLSRGSTNVVLAVLRTMLQAAVDDELILASPAARLARQLRLVQPPKARQEAIKAMTQEQLALFLDTAARVDRPHHPFWLTLARTGMRIGEARGSWWEDLNFAAREIRVARSLDERDEIDTPKSGHARTVDMSQELRKALLRLQLERKAETLRRGWREVPPWVFCNREGGPLNRIVLERAFKNVLKAAGLPLHFTPHCLRHTYASLLLQKRASPVYVQRQLGHSSIKLTVDTYGKWLPMGDKGLVDLLDGASGSKVVASSGVGEHHVMQLVDSSAPESKDREAVSIIRR